MASHGQALSLGALFHHLRDGLADRGPARITLDFRLESTTTEGGGGEGSHLFVGRGFTAQLDYQDELLHRAHLVTRGLAARPRAELFLRRQEERYLYSLDGTRFGLLIDTPRLFDVYSFESRLSHIAVRDVLLDEEPLLDGSVVNIIRVDVDEEAFGRLVRMFGDSSDDMAEALDDDGRTIVLTAAGDVAVDYQWANSREEIIPSDDGRPERYLSRHRSAVSIRLERLEQIPTDMVAIDPVLPELGGVDDVWSLTRIRSR